MSNLHDKSAKDAFSMKKENTLAIAYQQNLIWQVGYAMFQTMI